MSSSDQPTRPKRDTFFWLGQINKASAVINTSENLLDPDLAPRIARGLQSVLDAGGSNQNDDGGPGPRPKRVIDFEPVLIEAVGVEATLLHAGRSSQDMHAAASLAQYRDETLRLAKQVSGLIRALVDLAEAHADTLVPNYTNGVAAQPNSYGHYLLGHASGFLRDADRLREMYARMNQSPLGSTVLNGSSWPLNRERMASYMGFDGVVENAYDATQILSAELPVEMGSLATSIALHVGTFIQDIMVQYSQPRPWILLREGGDNTYVSSAMPQKRNPGILNSTRSEASRIVTLGMGRAIQSHNLVSGMVDPRSVADNKAVLKGAGGVLADLTKILGALDIHRERALEELNLDWTASQEIADVLMRDHGVPFRVGHHFASDMVSFGRQNNVKPSDFPHDEAQRLFTKACRDLNFCSVSKDGDGTLPLSCDALKATLDPATIVSRRQTLGGPQPSEMRRMIEAARKQLGQFETWTKARRRRIDGALSSLEEDFTKLREQ